MNRTMTSLIALGVGAAAYTVSRRNNNNVMSARSMRKMGRRVMKAIR